MVIVAGLDRLEGTCVGPSMTDAQWQSHTKELRERYEEARRTNEHVLINEFCREYAEGRVTTAAMRSVAVPPGRTVNGTGQTGPS